MTEHFDEVLKEDERVDWNVINKDGDTPVMHSVKLKRIEKAKLLLDISSVDLNVTDANSKHLEDVARFTIIYY